MIRNILIFCLLTIGAHAEDIAYTISSITETNEGRWILVDRAWRKDCPKRLEVKLRVSNDVPSKNVIVKAYFYDKDKKLIHSYAKPCIIWEGTDKGYEEIGMPAILKKNASTEVYFALTPELLKKFPRAILIVFGDQSTVSVKSKNEANPMDYEFAEKSLVSAVKK